MKQSKFILLIAVLSLFACQKEIEYKGPGKKSVLVLNAVVENDSTFRVYLEKTIFFLSSEAENAKHITSGATIVVKNETTGEIFTETTPTEANRYDFPFITAANTTYSIEVSHPDFESISAKMTTAGVIPLISVDTNFIIKEQMGYLKSTLTWNDPSGENYYVLRVIEHYDDGEVSYSYPAYLSSTDVAIDNSENTDIDGSVYPVSEFYFTDETFNGTQKKMDILFSFYPENPEFPTDRSYTYTLVSMNKESYLYYLSMKKNVNSGFFSEPVKVYSNITNGFGIFGSMNYSFVVL